MTLTTINKKSVTIKNKATIRMKASSGSLLIGRRYSRGTVIGLLMISINSGDS